MRACINLENGRIVAHIYNGTESGEHIDYGKVGEVSRAYVEGKLADMNHIVVLPWDIVALPPVGGVE